MGKIFYRHDLVQTGKVKEFTAKHPVGEVIKMLDLEGVEKSYIVKDVEVDSASVFHPDTHENLTRVTVTLETQ
jgi:hypothetical protein